MALAADLSLGEVTEVVALTGGVASDIARVVAGGKPYCVKFALEKLRVAADWHAPVHRSRAEYAWLSVAGGVVPGAVPALHGYSERTGGFAMDYVVGADVILWKSALLRGDAAGDAAARVADALGHIHAAGAAPGFDPSAFHNTADFHALRVEPYLLYTAQRHAADASHLRDLAAGLDAARVTLVHGDVSPKNILLRAGHPVFLDAECATMGDPAFDVAFCLNHLVLKSVHLPASRAGLLDAVQGFWRAYAGHVAWEDASALEGRVAALLPALMLARIDGKSPVEYLSEAERVRVRGAALALLDRPAVQLDEVTARLALGGRGR